MATPKWMLGLMACAALVVAQCDGDDCDKDDDCGCPQASVVVDDE